MTQPVQTVIGFREINDDNGTFVVEGDELKIRISKLFETNPTTPADLPMFAISLTNKVSGKMSMHYVYLQFQDHDTKSVNYNLLTELYVKQIIAGFQEQYAMLGGFLGDTVPLLAPVENGSKDPEAQYEPVAGQKFGRPASVGRFMRNYARFGYDGLYLVPGQYDELCQGLDSAINGFLISKSNDVNRGMSGYGVGEANLTVSVPVDRNRPAIMSISYTSDKNPALGIYLSADHTGEQLINYGPENESIWFTTTYADIPYTLRFTNRAQFGNVWTEDQINMVNVIASDTIINALAATRADKSFINHMATLDNYTRTAPTSRN